MQTDKGQSIEDKSMQIIDAEVGPHQYNELEWQIVRRVIHATADFDFANKNKIIFHKNAIKSGLDALESKKSIVVDVNGVIGGLNKKNPNDFGNKIICKISDAGIADEAKKLKKTRAQTAMRVAYSDIDGGIVVIGNAPTALLELIQMIKEKKVLPALVVGVPVGFVSAVESKEELTRLEVPFITNLGRKGGSPCASAIVNALYKILRQKSFS